MWTVVNAAILLANLATLGLPLKLYTEIFKQAAQVNRKPSGDDYSIQGLLK